MNPLKPTRLVTGAVALLLLLASAGAGLLRREATGLPCCTPSAELIWESLSRHVLPQAMR